MTRMTTTLLAATAFAFSASVAVACPFSKTDTTASKDGSMTVASSTLSTPIPADALQSDSLATHDVKTDTPVTADE